MGGILACVRETPHWAAEKDGGLSNQCHSPPPTRMSTAKRLRVREQGVEWRAVGGSYSEATSGGQ